MNGPHEESLEIRRPALVQPEVGPGRATDKVAEPAVANLVRDNIDEAAVASDQCWGGEGETSVLHSSVREARWEEEDVVGAPLLVAVAGDVLGDFDEPVKREIRSAARHREGRARPTYLFVSAENSQ